MFSVVSFQLLVLSCWCLVVGEFSVVLRSVVSVELPVEEFMAKSFRELKVWSRSIKLRL